MKRPAARAAGTVKGTVRFARVAAILVLAALVAAAAGCSRLDTLNRRLDAIADREARTAVRDVLWAGGSKYRWTDHTTLRAEVTRTEHRPAGDAATDEVWLLDLWSGRSRIERPAARQVAVSDGSSVRVFVDGRETADPEARARAAAEARLVRELLPMPFSLAGPGRQVTYVGTRTGPAEARVWQRLLVKYAGPWGADGGETLVEVREGLRRVDACLLRWPEYPLAGRPMRVGLDDWRKVDGLSLSHRWRATPIDEKGEAAGPLRWTVRVNRAGFDAAVGPRAFAAP